MDWIMLRTNLIEHPKMLKLSRCLRVKKTEALGLCALLWSKAYGITKNGELRYAPEDLDELIGKRGFTNALVDVGWAELNADGYVVLPGWHKYCGLQQERQEAARLRQRNSRQRRRNLQQSEDVTYDNLSRDVTVTNCDCDITSRTYIGRCIDNNKKDTIVSKKAKYLPSSFDDVLASFAEGLPGEVDDIESWYLRREAQGWRTTAGTPIRNWKADLQLWLKNKPTQLSVAGENIKNSAPAYVPTVNVEVN